MTVKSVIVQLDNVLSLLKNYGVDQLLESTALSKKAYFTSRILGGLRVAPVLKAALTSPSASLGIVFDRIRPYLGLGESETSKFLNDIYRAPIEALVEILGDPKGINIIYKHKETLLTILSQVFNCSQEECYSHILPMLDSLFEVLRALPKIPKIKNFPDLISAIYEQISKNHSDHVEKQKFIDALELFTTKTIELAVKRHGFFDDLIVRLTYYPGTDSYKRIVQPNFEHVLSKLDQGGKNNDMHLFFSEFRKDGNTSFLNNFAEEVMKLADFSYLDIKPLNSTGEFLLCDIKAESTGEIVKAINFSGRKFKGVSFKCSEFGPVSFVDADLRGANFYLANFNGPVDFTGAIIDNETLQTLLPSIRHAMHRVDIKFPLEWRNVLHEKEIFTEELDIRRRLMELADVVYNDVYDSKHKLNNSMAFIDMMYNAIFVNASNVAECRALCYMLSSSESRVKFLKKTFSPDVATQIVRDMKVSSVFNSLSEGFQDFLYKPTARQALNSGQDEEVSRGMKSIVSLVNEPAIANFLEDRPRNKAKRFGEFVRAILEKKLSSSLFSKDSKCGQFIVTHNFSDFIRLGYFLLKNFHKVLKCYRQITPVLIAIGLGKVTLSKAETTKNIVELINIFIKNDIAQQSLTHKNNGVLEVRFSCVRLLYLTQKFLPTVEDAEKLSKALYQFCVLVKERDLGSLLQDYVTSSNSLAKGKAMNELLAKANNTKLIQLLSQLQPLFSSMLNKLSDSSNSKSISSSMSRTNFVNRVIGGKSRVEVAQTRNG